MFDQQTGNQDQQLLALLRSNPQQTLQAVFAENRANLRGMIASKLDRRLLGRVDPSDIVQETLIEATRRLKTYLSDPRMPFMDWLMYLANQNTVAAYRKHMGAQKRSISREQHGVDAPQADDQWIDDIANDTKEPHAKVIHVEDQELLQKSLSQLSEMEQFVIELRYFQGKRIADVAAELDISVDAATKRIHRTLTKLCELMKRLG